jgi:hypothetical protein
MDAVAALDSGLPDLTAAIIAAVLGFVGLVIAKENKTSEFRQQWIDSLRQDLSDYIAAVRLIAQSHKQFAAIPQPHEGHVELADQLKEVYLASSSSLARIRLRLNPDDRDPKLKELNLQLLKRVKEAQDALAAADYPQALRITNHLHEQAGPVLKLEWSRVKRGEWIYQLAKWGTLLFLVSLFVLAIVGYAVVVIRAVS